MTRREYRKYTANQLRGMTVVALRDLTSGVMSIPKGTRLTIRSKANGLNLSTEGCPKCGVKMFIRKVEPEAVELTLPVAGKC